MVKKIKFLPIIGIVLYFGVVFMGFFFKLSPVLSGSSFISNMSIVETVYLYSGLLFAGRVIHYVKQR